MTSCNSCGPGGRLGFGLHSRHCDDCVPPWTPYFGHYKQRMDDCVTRCTAKRCAMRALHQYKRQCPEAVTCDFAAGFERAYIDLAENRAPQPPSVPPSKYWSAYYRSCAGRPRIEDWYAGYQVGLEQGLQSGVSRFNRVDIWRSGGSMATAMPVSDAPAGSSGAGCGCGLR